MRGASFIFILPSLRIIPPFHRAALVLWESFSSTIPTPEPQSSLSTPFISFIKSKT